MIDIYNDDCFKTIEALINKHVLVDAIICDPPYIINYSDWDKEFDMQRFSNLCYQILKPNGNLISCFI